VPIAQVHPVNAVNRQKDLVLFVHGFGSSSKCWEPMLKLLRDDDQVTSQYEFDTWDYPTKWMELNLLGRIPRLQEIGRSLADKIDLPPCRGRRITLVGHSQGGLVIQSYIAELLTSGQGSQLRNVQQAIFFATPSEGSTTAMNFRRLFSTVFTNPQEMTLRVLNPDVSDLRAIIGERVVSATTDSATSWRVPIHAFCGLQDNIVPEASARGVFDNIKEVEGTHFSIIQPSDRRDARYAEFVQLLLEPGGHAHRFDVETYECVVRVEPRQMQSIRTSAEKDARTVTFDNYATQTRTVRFSPANKCKDKFKLYFRTRKEGFVVGHPSQHNEASPADIGLSEDTGTFYEFDFTPDAGNEYRLKAEIYRGFDEGNRNIHYHLGNDSRYRRMIYVLDLSAYIVDHYVITDEPHFYLDPTDVGHSELCDQRTLRDPLEPVSRTPDGMFRWELERVEQGVVDIVWDVARIDAPSVTAGGVASAQVDDGKTDPSSH
jgi:pimeloyl-ACP methyl ester carboxylesterase